MHNHGDGTGGDRRRSALHVIHELEEFPGIRVGFDPLGSVALPELLDLVAALRGGFGELVEAAAGRDGDGHLLPLVGLERAAIQRVPFLSVSLDEADRLLGGPGEGRGLLRERRGEGGEVSVLIGARWRGGTAGHWRLRDMRRRRMRKKLRWRGEFIDGVKLVAEEEDGGGLIGGWVDSLWASTDPFPYIWAFHLFFPKFFSCGPARSSRVSIRAELENQLLGLIYGSRRSRA
ncbi:unnamed protein product [Cuscuta campestris]|uniref:Uncharacterized protein n=1 Tax=Cuscuta campestris TaxID=132261 RepID=A0A484NHK0_9ASTE|nr:unnamed protein product [Cuscuta campestris]